MGTVTKKAEPADTKKADAKAAHQKALWTDPLFLKGYDTAIKEFEGHIGAGMKKKK